MNHISVACAGALAALVAAFPLRSGAAPAPAMALPQPTAYANLFRLIPNAHSVVAAADAAHAVRGEAVVQDVQYHRFYHHPFYHHHFYHHHYWHHRYYHHGPVIRVIP